MPVLKYLNLISYSVYVNMLIILSEPLLLKIPHLHTFSVEAVFLIPAGICRDEGGKYDSENHLEPREKDDVRENGECV